jgi:hypothetical protein
MAANILAIFLLFCLIVLNEAKSFTAPYRLSNGKKTSNLSQKYRVSKELENCLALRGGDGVDWRHFFSGSVCAAFSHGVTTPIGKTVIYNLCLLIFLRSSSLFLSDVVKTKMQTSPEKYNKGMLHAASDIIKTEGISFLLAGLGGFLRLLLFFLVFLFCGLILDNFCRSNRCRLWIRRWIKIWLL